LLSDGYNGFGTKSVFLLCEFQSMFVFQMGYLECCEAI
jgi:hypothetical protein